MKTKFRIICLGLVFVIFYSCRTIKETSFLVPDGSLTSVLPPLRASVDIKNLKDKISYGKISVSGYYHNVLRVPGGEDTLSSKMDASGKIYEVLKDPKRKDRLKVKIYDENFKRNDYFKDTDKYYTKATFTPEVRVYDILRIISNEVYGNEIDYNKEYYGSIQIKLQSFEEKRNKALTFLSIWTFCFINLVGFPLTSINTNLEIQVIIYNILNEPIKTYKGEGSGVAFIAMYWGYGEDAWRISAIDAFKNAMQSVKQQIREDEKELGSKLLLPKNKSE